MTDSVARDAARGDRDAVGVVYAALSPAILGYLRARGVDDPEAMTNDVFVKLLPIVPELKGGADGLRKLAFTIARARMIDSLRARSRAGTTVPFDPTLDNRAVPSAEDDAQAALALARVHAVLDLLPEEQREVVTLRVVGDLTVEQVAAVMGKSSGAVKQLQRRGMVAIRRALQERRVTL